MTNNNETKRDVVDDLLCAYDDAIAVPGALRPTKQLLNYNARYDAALPDDLPVIPEVTGKFIKAMKANGDSLFASESTVLLMYYLDLIPFDALKITKWIDEHQNTIARAWLLGVWRVEETGEIVKLEAEK